MEGLHLNCQGNRVVLGPHRTNALRVKRGILGPLALVGSICKSYLNLDFSKGIPSGLKLVVIGGTTLIRVGSGCVCSK